VGPPGERKEEVEVFVSSAVGKSKRFATELSDTKSCRINGLTISTPRGGDEECHARCANRYDDCSPCQESAAPAGAARAGTGLEGEPTR
jgi:hypothetical protein